MWKESATRRRTASSSGPPRIFVSPIDREDIDALAKSRREKVALSPPAGAVDFFTAMALGMPVSATHTITGAIVGPGVRPW